MRQWSHCSGSIEGEIRGLGPALVGIALLSLSLHTYICIHIYIQPATDGKLMYRRFGPIDAARAPVRKDCRRRGGASLWKRVGEFRSIGRRARDERASARRFVLFGDGGGGRRRGILQGVNDAEWRRDREDEGGRGGMKVSFFERPKVYERRG